MKNSINVQGTVYRNEAAWTACREMIQSIQPSKIFVLVDPNTQEQCLPYLLKQLSLKATPELLTMPEGEVYKNIPTCLSLWEALSEKGADRKSLLINLGGGVVTDLGGFVASTFKRGIPFINIPTTLLAMVDASVGGKNGVDLGTIKNQIGVINNPKMIVVDTSFLKTLANEQLISGLAEMLKHGIIHSEVYWEKVKLFDASNTSTTEALIWESIAIKNTVVTKDPHEKNLRKTLNYGHTLGHAIESYCLEHTDRKTLLHGEAIAIGMILATYFSSELLPFPKEKLDDISQTILQKFPKVSFSKTDIDAIIKLLIYDKKNRNGKVFFVLLEDIGIHKIDCEVSNDLIHKGFGYYENFLE